MQASPPPTVRTQISRPQISRPQISRPQISRPQISRPQIRPASPGEPKSPEMGVTPIADAGDGCHTDTAGVEDQTAKPAAAAAEPALEPAEDPGGPEPVAAELVAAELVEAWPVAAEPLPDAQLTDVLAGLTSLSARVDELTAAASELARLRNRDTDLIARLHDDVTRLRTGEIAAALNPVVTGMIKLHDQMVSLGALNDPDSPVGMLHTQLLQTMELTCAVKPFSPAAGERFDASRHTGIRRIPTTDASADGTIAGTVRAGFARADGSVVRVAEVEVHRLSG